MRGKRYEVEPKEPKRVLHNDIRVLEENQRLHPRDTSKGMTGEGDKA